ncbi:MAG: DUF4287 domain-containing protein [Gemmatimonadales bacterium]|nr:DUF4287 domain-containing protein [Gemmatimonadales bacterium]MDQ3426471.1 DUF4287 domain-containing protein [Gemmatimonadota bacterium]
MAKREVTQWAGVSDESVLARTGRSWRQWFTVLDRAGAQRMTHKEIVAVLVANHELGPWWQQMVTVGYEQWAGLRDRYQKPEGYEISGSKVVPVPVNTLYRAWRDRRQRGRWLPDAPFEFGKATPDKSLRLLWRDGTKVDVFFVVKGEEKSRVSLQHRRLPNAKAAAAMKQFWKEGLGRLAEVLAARAR